MEKLLQALICIDDRTPEETEVNIKKKKKKKKIKKIFSFDIVLQKGNGKIFGFV